MGLLLTFTRRMYLIRAKSEVNMKILNITKKLGDLTRYASNIADGKISLRDMYDIPSRLFQRQSIFQMTSHQNAVMTANMQMAAMGGMLAMQLGQMPPEMQAMYQQQIFMNLYSEARKEAAQQEQKLLNEQEAELTTEKAKLQALAEEYDVELKSLDQQQQKDYDIFKVA